MPENRSELGEKKVEMGSRTSNVSKLVTEDGKSTEEVLISDITFSKLPHASVYPPVVIRQEYFYHIQGGKKLFREAPVP